MDRSDLPLLPLALCFSGWAMYWTFPAPFVRLTGVLLPMAAGIVALGFWLFALAWAATPERDPRGPRYLVPMAMAAAGLAALVWQATGVEALVQLVAFVPPLAAALMYGAARLRVRQGA